MTADDDRLVREVRSMCHRDPHAEEAFVGSGYFEFIAEVFG
eukprot:CAMPEP_0182522452 /NCGR_PEP_ID=MMETSP1323-20130603/310_1 /TAXON_ID=236787 /ORGANISM="Florenciella parvula, Strain RCC1693" /LENGTH=40 /DNA_ID= /DNA_START= /DNA_END= /DNA_ORIENTATION=